MNQLRITEAAARSILEQADYYRQNAGEQLAERWEASVDQAIRSLLQMPERGARARFSHPELAELRWLAVPGFRRHLIFFRYEQAESIVLVVQVLHGARNLESAMGIAEEAE